MGHLPLLSQSNLDALNDQPPIGIVTGYLEIWESEGPITDLSPLHCLAVVEGNADIMLTENLVSLAGLELLKRVEGALNINAHSALTDVQLPSLEEVGADFFFHHNQVFSGELVLPALETLGDDLSVYDNAALRGFSLPRLRAADKVAIRENPQLRAVSLPLLESATDGINFYRNPAMLRIDLSALREVHGGPLNIEQNLLLNELLLDRIEELSRGFRLITNRSLTALELPELHTLLRTLVIRDTDRLLRVRMPLAQVDPVTDVVIEDNRGLRELELSRVAFVRSVRIATNPSLHTVDLTGLSHVAIFELLENSSLTRLDLAQLAGVTPNGNTPGLLRVESNLVLGQLGIEALNTLDHRLTVVGNPRIDACTVLGHALRIGMSNPDLVTVEDNDDSAMTPALIATDQDELDAYAGTRCVRGSMTLGSPVPNEVFHFDAFDALADLESVFGAVSLLGVESGAAIKFPRLEWVGGSFNVAGLGAVGPDAPGTLELTMLRSAGGMILSAQSKIDRVDASSLRVLTGQLRIRNMEVLTELEFPEIRVIEGGLTVQCNALLDSSVLEKIVELAEPTFVSLCGGPGLAVCVQAVDETTCS